MKRIFTFGPSLMSPQGQNKTIKEGKALGHRGRHTHSVGRTEVKRVRKWVRQRKALL